MRWCSEGSDWRLYRLSQNIRDLYQEIDVWGDFDYLDTTGRYAPSPFILAEELLDVSRRLPNIKRLSVDASAFFIESKSSSEDFLRALVDNDEEEYEDDDSEMENFNSKLTQLQYQAGEHDLQSEKLAYLLERIPNLKRLEICLMESSLRSNGSPFHPIPFCPNLEVLHIYANSKELGIFSPLRPLIPFTSLTHLKELRFIISDIRRTQVLNIVNLACATLEAITIKVDEDLLDFLQPQSWKYSIWEPVLPTLKVLRLFDVPIGDLPLNFTDILPLSLTTLISPIEYSHLLYLSNHPRPDLKLWTVDLGYSIEAYREVAEFPIILPPSVLKLKIQWIESCIEMILEDFEGIRSRGSNAAGLRELEIEMVSGGKEKHTQDEIADLISRFRMIGIKLTVKYWVAKSTPQVTSGGS